MMKKLKKSRNIDIERDFIIKTRALALEKLKDSSGTIDAFTIDKMKKLINRMIDNEIDFLYDETEEYLDLYCKDHLKN